VNGSSRRLLSAGLFAVAGLTLAGVVAAQSPSSSAPAAARDGVYAATQAARGKDAYLASCAHCHATDLQGDVRQEIPSLAESDFFVRWANRSLGELFERISQDMPQDKPGTLQPRQYADILAYVLSVNGFPAGSLELPADAARLKQIELGMRPNHD
jgi:mono/diheme cytochrome c family protein